MFSIQYEKTGPNHFFKTNDLEKYLKKTDQPKDNPQIHNLKYLAGENKKIADGIKPDTFLNPFDYNMQRLRDLPAPNRPLPNLKIRNIAFIIEKLAIEKPYLLDDFNNQDKVALKSLEYA